MEASKGSPDSFKSVLAFFTLIGGGVCVLAGIVSLTGPSLGSGLLQVGVGLILLGVAALYVGYRVGQDVGWKF